VSAGRVHTFRALADRWRARPARLGSVRLVAIDGPGGAGKSTFAARVAAACGGAPVVHTDDLASWDEQLDWWQRLEDEVLAPLAAGVTARFRPTDWVAGGLQRHHLEVPAAPLVVLEGVSASRRRVTDRLSGAVYVDAPAVTRLARGLERDGQDALGLWETWMAEEDAWFAKDRPWERADLLVDGTPDLSELPHDPAVAFVASEGPGSTAS
jgi:uridine kinase